MSPFVIGYYAALIAASFAAAYWKNRSVFMLLFTLLLVSPPPCEGGLRGVVPLSVITSKLDACKLTYYCFC